MAKASHRRLVRALVALQAFVCFCAALAMAQISPWEDAVAAVQQLPESGAVRDAIVARDYPHAEELLIHAINADPSTRKLLLTLGGVFFLDKKYENCAVALEKARAANLLNADSRFTLALAYVNLGKRDWARQELERLAVAIPNKAIYRFWLTRLDFADQKYSACLKNSEHALRIDPGFWRAFNSAGLCHEALGNTSEAIAAYRKAMQLSRPDDSQAAWPAMNLGAALSKTGQWDAAQLALDEAIRRNARFAMAFYYRGVVHENRGRLDAAIEDLRQAVALDSQLAEPHYALARIYRTRGDTAAANMETAAFAQSRRLQ